MTTRAALKAKAIAAKAAADAAEAEAAEKGATAYRTARARKAQREAAVAEGNADLADLLSTVDQDYQVVPIDSIRKHPRNANLGDIASIRESMQVNDFYGACIVQKSTGYILAGNHRWMVAKEEGLKEIPVIFVDVDDQKALRILIADNATARRAKVDEEATRRILKDLGALKDPSKLRGTGVLPADLNALERIIANDFDASGTEPVFALNVTCSGEEDQEALYDELRGRGYDIKVVTL